MIGFLWQRSGLGESDLRLNGPRVYLRPPAAEDYQSWSALREESRAFLVPWEPEWTKDSLTRAAYRRRLRRYALDRRAGTGCSLLILRQADDALLGGISLGNIRRAAAQAASIGYWIGAPHARQGYMTEALDCVIAFAFQKLGLHRIEAACLPANAPSQALLRRAQFRLEGEARKYLCINGIWQDHEIYALLREDWATAA
ncbi:MAG: GNAT family protein [Alphaproteobacteria bacterium]|nr:GNAT family protein [Alphaproteobacteria bacterium]